MERQNNRKNWSTATAGTATTTAFLLTIPLLTYIILFYGATSILYPTASNNGNNTSEEHEANISSVDDNNATGIVVGPMKKNVTNITETTIGGRRSMDDVERPSCPISYKNKLLSDMLNDLYVNATMCRPQDVTDPRKHRLPKVASKTNKTAEPRGTMVVYIAVGLLLTSLGAAIVELYKAKGQAMATRKTKPTLTRKCSLADLTVLKHNRKELMRRDTMWDIPEGRNATEQLGRKVCRPPLRLVD